MRLSLAKRSFPSSSPTIPPSFSSQRQQQDRYLAHCRLPLSQQRTWYPIWCSGQHYGFSFRSPEFDSRCGKFFWFTIKKALTHCVVIMHGTCFFWVGLHHILLTKKSFDKVLKTSYGLSSFYHLLSFYWTIYMQLNFQVSIATTLFLVFPIPCMFV